MQKVIRPTYPAQFSIGVLLLVFSISFFLSHQIFHVPFDEKEESGTVYLGMFLVSMAVITMVLILWEDILFPVKIKQVEGGAIFRNHRTKLKTQMAIFCIIPGIYAFIYLEFDINPIRFYIWAAVCMIAPIIQKIASGINNYNDFLKLTKSEIEFKNNEKEGSFKISEIQNIVIFKQEKIVSEKIQLHLHNNEIVMIDLDEMELEDFYDSINEFIEYYYQNLLKETIVA